MGGFLPIIDPTTGKITGYKTDVGGADTVFPFNTILTKSSIQVHKSSINVKVGEYYVLAQFDVQFASDLSWEMPSIQGGKVISGGNFINLFTVAHKNGNIYGHGVGIFIILTTSTTLTINHGNYGMLLQLT